MTANGIVSGAQHTPTGARRDERALRVGLIGCGAVAEKYHAPALAQGAALGLTDLTQLLDPSAARVLALRRQFPNARSVATVDALAGEIDLAIVASPVRFHADQVCALLGLGIHVLCEKPLARNSAEAATMVAAAQASGRILAVGLFRRFFPVVEWIGQTIRSGTLGRVVGFHLDEGGRFGWPAVTATFFDRAQSGGGVTMDIGVHMFDIAHHWFGAPQSIEYTDDAYGGIEINAAGTLRFHDGIEGSFRLSWDVPLSGIYALDFERGWIRWATNSAQSASLGFEGVTYGADARLAVARKDLPRGLERESPGYVAAFTAQLMDVVTAIREGRAPRVDGASGAVSLEWIERMYAERDVLLPPHFTDAERASARALAEGVAK